MRAHQGLFQLQGEASHLGVFSPGGVPHESFCHFSCPLFPSPTCLSSSVIVHGGHGHCRGRLVAHNQSVSLEPRGQMPASLPVCTGGLGPEVWPISDVLSVS